MRLSTWKVLVLSSIMIISSAVGLNACNLSNVTLISVTGSGPYVITLELCVGMGLTGSTKGGDQRTTNILFGFWDATPGFTVLPGFTPAQMVSPAPPQATVPPSCTMTGVVTGAGPWGTSGILAYVMPNTVPCAGGSGTSYGCVNSTVLCGDMISSCSTYVISVNQLPDSMRVFGVEGAGNPVGGCFSNSDMLIVFPEGLPVEWGEVAATPTTTGVQIEWETFSELNADYFSIERATPAGDFESIGEVIAVGNPDDPQQYSFVDNAPAAGQNRYRIVEIDRNGGSSDSKIVEASYGKPAGITWGEVGPNPALDGINITFFYPQAEEVSISLIDVQGKIVSKSHQQAIAGGNAKRIDLSGLRPGNYFVQVQGSKGSLVRKITKL